MSLQTYAWLVLAFPLAGSLLIALTFKVLPDRVHGWLGTLAIALAFAASIGAFIELESLDEEARQVVSVGWDYAVTSGVAWIVTGSPATIIRSSCACAAASC